jgi:hypothetical protein
MSIDLVVRNATRHVTAAELEELAARCIDFQNYIEAHCVDRDAYELLQGVIGFAIRSCDQKTRPRKLSVNCGGVHTLLDQAALKRLLDQLPPAEAWPRPGTRDIVGGVIVHAFQELEPTPAAEA